MDARSLLPALSQRPWALVFPEYIRANRKEKRAGRGSAHARCFASWALTVLTHPCHSSGSGSGNCSAVNSQSQGRTATGVERKDRKGFFRNQGGFSAWNDAECGEAAIWIIFYQDKLQFLNHEKEGRKDSLDFLQKKKKKTLKLCTSMFLCEKLNVSQPHIHIRVASAQPTTFSLTKLDGHPNSALL